MPTTINTQRILHKGRTFQFIRENVTLENGATVDLDMVRHPGAAAIVPFLTDGTLLLLRQYRHAVGGTIWEIPAGTLNPGETGISCAKRELIEETGYSAAQWKTLGTITPVPGYSDERITLFLARDLSPAEQHLDRDEVLDVHEVPLTDALEMIARGDIQDAKTICGLYMTSKIRS